MVHPAKMKKYISRRDFKPAFLPELGGEALRLILTRFGIKIA